MLVSADVLFFFLSVDIEKVTGQRHNALGVHHVHMCAHLESSCSVIKLRLHTNLLRNRHDDEIGLGRVNRGSRPGTAKHSLKRLRVTF